MMSLIEETNAAMKQAGSRAKKKQAVLDMKKLIGEPYIVDVSKLIQTRVDTGKRRKIHRKQLTVPYTPAQIDQDSASDGAQGISSSNNAPVTRSTLGKRKQIAASTGVSPVSQKPAAMPSICGRQKAKKDEASAKKNSTKNSRESLPTENNIKISTKTVNKEQSAEEVLGRYMKLVINNTESDEAIGGDISYGDNDYGSDLDVSEDDDGDDELVENDEEGSQRNPGLKQKEKKYGCDPDDGRDLGETQEETAEDCCICCDKLSSPSSYGEGLMATHVVELNRCGHKFHRLCLLEMYRAVHKDNSIQCPSCKFIYGEKTGICPPGTMRWSLLKGHSIAGYEGSNTISVSYDIRPGIQGPEHPHPGQGFHVQGFPREGYLPDTDKGRKVLKLLIEAWKRRLMFTIGTSYTTGASNVVVWNEIHHKTELHGNYSGHGYPDPGYLDNVILELACHGVTDDCL